MRQSIRRGVVSSLATALCCLGGIVSTQAASETVGLVAAGPVEPLPSAVRFDQFDKVEVQYSVLGEYCRQTKLHRQSAQLLDELLLRDLSRVFPGMRTVGRFSDGEARTLEITPVIQEIDIQSDARRYWLSWAAGKSFLRIKLVCRDSASGQVIAEPSFYRETDALEASWTSGFSDRLIREEIVQDAVRYMLKNL